jgi:hypothetical protein
MIDTIPISTVSHTLLQLPLASLPLALGSLQRVSKVVGAVIDDDEVWLAVATQIHHRGECSGAARRSSRLATATPRERFKRAWRAVLSRSEAFHHLIACHGQDGKDLCRRKAQLAHAQFAPLPLPDRVSPVYNATVLMEACRTRGVREDTITAVVEWLVLDIHANPAASNSDGCTPLMIAAARGMPKLAALLLALGADPRPAGTGRFRVCGTSQSVHGKHTALEWTCTLLAREVAAGVAAKDMRSLEEARRLMELHPAPVSHTIAPHCTRMYARSLAAKLYAKAKPKNAVSALGSADST